MVCTSALLPAGLTLPFSPPLARLSIFILRFAKLPKSKNYWGKGWAHREIRFLSPFALSHAVLEFVPRHPLPSASDPRHLDDRPPPLSNSVLDPCVSSPPTSVLSLLCSRFHSSIYPNAHLSPPLRRLEASQLSFFAKSLILRRMLYV